VDDQTYEYFERVRDYDIEPIVIVRRRRDGTGLPEQWHPTEARWMLDHRLRSPLENGLRFAPISSDEVERAIDPTRPDPARTVRRVEPLMTSTVAPPDGSDGWGKLTTAAIALHEMFRSYVAAGFTEDQAMTLVLEMLRQGRDERDGDRSTGT